MPGDRGAGPGASGRDLAAHHGASPAAVAATRVLSDLPGRLHEPLWPGYRQPGGPRLLAIAPTPAAAAKLSVTRIAAALRRAGRSRGIDQTAAEIKAGLRNPNCANRFCSRLRWASTRWLCSRRSTPRTPMSTTWAGRLRSCSTASRLRDHHEFPGLADSTGARVLAEIGDDRARFADARALNAYAGSAPITRASGRSISVTHRHIKNNRLANAGWMWAFLAASNCEPAPSITASGENTATACRSHPPPVQQAPRPAPPLPPTSADLRRDQGISAADLQRRCIAANPVQTVPLEQLAN